MPGKRGRPPLKASVQTFTVDELLAEKMFHDWVTNNKSLTQLALDHGVDYQRVIDAKDRFQWAERRKNIFEKLRNKHEKEILKIKSEIFKTTETALKIASRKIKEFHKNKIDGVVYDNMGKLVLTDAFMKNTKDWKTLVETFYLVLNDGVEKKELDGVINHNVQLTDTQAAKLLEVMAESEVIDVTPTEERTEEPLLLEESKEDEKGS